MPPKRSRRPRSRAAKAKAVTAPPKKRTRRHEPSPSTQSSEPAPAATPQPTSQELAFPPGLIDQLVSRVADEVTKRLSVHYITIKFHNSQMHINIY